MSPGFLGQNANKRSIAVDLKAEAGLAIVHDLLETADVVVINMRPGTAGRLGIDELLVGAALVPGAIAGFAASGPLRKHVDARSLVPIVLIGATAAAVALLAKVFT